MQYFGTARAEFESGHQLDDLERCARQHGHRYSIEAECVGRLNSKTGMALDLDGFSHALRTLCGELDGRHLSDMLPGVTTTPYGIAAWFMERLLLEWPVIRVSLSESGSTVATVTREVRAYGLG